jgi:glyoxylase-like metal-dependent hydrolase (beta-lactamase superfamily II)
MLASRNQALQGICLGLFETNAWWFAGPDGWILFDAPEGTAAEMKRVGGRVALLVLTHGHFDHMWDAAEIKRDHQCPVWFHQADADLCRHPKEVMQWLGLPHRIHPIEADKFLEGNVELDLGGKKFQTFHIPGHSPGSLCFYCAEEEWLIGGDVLFAGGVGRWDLPGGSQAKLIEGIRRDLLPLPDSTEVFPGHGPTTTIGNEKKFNPYVR